MDTDETKNFLSGMYWGKKNIHLFSNLMLKINEYGFLSARGFLLHAAQPVTVVTECVVCVWQ
jgi:hypothetical protein